MLVGLIAASAVSASAQITQVTNLPTNRSVGLPSINSDGRYVAFHSNGDIGGLNPTPSTNVFVYEVLTGEFARLTNQGGTDPSISADGRWVAFSSSADYVGRNYDESDEIFKHDRYYNRKYQVTRDRLGDGSSGMASISGDGKRLAFESNSNLRGRNPDFSDEVYVRRGANGAITHDPEGDGGSYSPVISADGGFVAFVSSSNLTGYNGDFGQELFLYNIRKRQLNQITIDIEGNGESWAPSISADGRYTAFMSSSNINGSNPDNDDVLVLLDRRRGKSILNRDTVGFFPCDSPSVSGDGEWIAFKSSADVTGGNPDRNTEIVLYNRTRKTFAQITDSAGCVNGDPKLAGDATRIALLSRCNYTGENADGSNELFVIVNTAFALEFHSEGPMWMDVRDPNDNIINPNINWIPRATYTTGDFDGDTIPEVLVHIPKAEEGIYRVTMYSNPGAPLTDPISVDATLNGVNVQLGAGTVQSVVGIPMSFGNQGFTRRSARMVPLSGYGSLAYLSARLLHDVPASGPVKVRFVAGDADFTFDLGLIENLANLGSGGKLFKGPIGAFTGRMSMTPKPDGASIRFKARHGDLFGFAGDSDLAMVMVVQMGLNTGMHQWRFARLDNGNLVLQ